MNNLDQALLTEVCEPLNNDKAAYSFRKNGKSIEKKINSYINIVSKPDNTGLDIYVKENTLFGIIQIPVIITESGLTDIVYNDFHIGKNANVIIFAGCAIHNDQSLSQHNGIHRFYLAENAKVKYVEKHYGQGDNDCGRIINPTTEIYMSAQSQMNMETFQIKGVSNTKRLTNVTMDANTKLEITEKILTAKEEQAYTEFNINLNGANASAHIISRSVASDHSYQEFKSNVTGNTQSYAHIECDAIIKDDGQVRAIPEIYAKNVEANLVHEASIGKIAGEQLNKLMTLGLNEKEAEEIIIKGFLK